MTNKLFRTCLIIGLICTYCEYYWIRNNYHSLTFIASKCPKPSLTSVPIHHINNLTGKDSALTWFWNIFTTEQHKSITCETFEIHLNLRSIFILIKILCLIGLTYKLIINLKILPKFIRARKTILISSMLKGDGINQQSNDEDRLCYLVHFARLFFACILLGICSLFSHLWNVNQPLQLAFQFQRCQSSSKIPRISIWNWLNTFHLVHLFPTFSFLSTKCHLHIKDNYPLNINQFLGLFQSILLIYFVYHLICLSLFHAHLKQFQDKQHYYAQRYRQDQKSRCSKRLLKT